MKKWSGKNDIPTESYLWRSALCVCVCVMCLCNICIDVKRLTQGAQVWLSFLCQRRPPDVTAISRGDVPLTYLQFFLHLFSDRRGTGPKPRTPRSKSSSFSWSSCCMVSANHFSDHFLFVSCNWNTRWHVDRCVKWTSRGMGNKTWIKPPFASYNPHLLWSAIVFIHHIFLAGENAWSNSLGKKLPIDFLYNFYEFPLACVLSNEFPIIIHIFHKLPTYFYAPTNLLRTQGCEMLAQGSTNATATTGHHTNLPCHRRHWGGRHRAGKMVVTQILCVSDWRSHMKSKGESTHVLVKITLW